MLSLPEPIWTRQSAELSTGVQDVLSWFAMTVSEHLFGLTERGRGDVDKETGRRREIDHVLAVRRRTVEDMAVITPTAPNPYAEYGYAGEGFHAAH